MDSLLWPQRSSAQHLVVECIRDYFREGRKTLGPLPIAGEIDWREVCRTARRHGILPLVRQSLRQAPNSVPKPVLRLLDRDFRSIAARNLALSCELVRILGFLAAAGIRALAWKGPALGAALYRTPCLREFLDLDILVSPDDVSRAARVLAACGYEGCQPSAGDPGLARLEASRHLTLLRSDPVTAVELHWDVGLGRAASKLRSGLSLDFEALWNRRENVPLCGSTVPHLGAEQLLLALSIHGAWHYWSRLNWICDIATVVRTYTRIDWPALFDAAARLHCRRRLCLALRLASDLLGVRLPRAVLVTDESLREVSEAATAVVKELFRSETATGAGGGEQGRAAEWISDLRDVAFTASLSDRYRDRIPLWLAYVRAHLQPTASDRRVIRLPACFAGAYYLIRPARLLWDYGPANAGRLLRIVALGGRARELGEIQAAAGRLGPGPAVLGAR